MLEDAKGRGRRRSLSKSARIRRVVASASFGGLDHPLQEEAEPPPSPRACDPLEVVVELVPVRLEMEAEVQMGSESAPSAVRWN